MKCWISAHTSVHHEFSIGVISEQQKKEQEKPTLTFFSCSSLQLRKQQRLFALKIHGYSKFVVGNLREGHVLVTTTKLAQHDLPAGLPRQAACDSSSAAPVLGVWVWSRHVKYPVSHFPYTWAQKSSCPSDSIIPPAKAPPSQGALPDLQISLPQVNLTSAFQAVPCVFKKWSYTSDPYGSGSEGYKLTSLSNPLPPQC